MTAEHGKRCSIIEEITRRACAAAEEGCWDLVGQAYRERESELAAGCLTNEEKLRILEMDRWVEERVRVAQSALASLLQGAAVQRQRIEDVRRRVGGMSRSVNTILVQA